MKEYEQYLQKVRDAHADEYGEISEIKTRYETLQNANVDLQRQLKKIEEENEKEKAATIEYQKESIAKIMSLTNET